MSPENLARVGTLYSECFAPGNLELVPEILHPEIVWTAIESAPDAGTRRGHAESRAHMSDWLDSFDFEAMPIDKAGATDDGRLVCSLAATGTEKRSGLTTEIRYAGVFRFADDGRIIEIHEYATLGEALKPWGCRSRRSRSRSARQGRASHRIYRIRTSAAWYRRV
jgi:ketosteroid isomerase-like protein